MTEWIVQQGRTQGVRPVRYDVEQDIDTASNAPIFTGTLLIDGEVVGKSVKGFKKKLVEHQCARLLPLSQRSSRSAGKLTLCFSPYRRLAHNAMSNIEESLSTAQ